MHSSSPQLICASGPLSFRLCDDSHAFYLRGRCGNRILLRTYVKGILLCLKHENIEERYNCESLTSHLLLVHKSLFALSVFSVSHNDTSFSGPLLSSRLCWSIYCVQENQFSIEVLPVPCELGFIGYLTNSFVVRWRFNSQIDTRGY